MTTTGITKVIRQFIEYAFTLWATIVFQGLVLGSFLLFLRCLMSPIINNRFGDFIDINMPNWLFFTTGIAIILALTALRGKPLLKDNNREQLEAIDYFVQKLPEIEKMLLYRRLAYKLVDEFKLDKKFHANILKNLEMDGQEEHATNGILSDED